MVVQVMVVRQVWAETAVVVPTADPRSIPGDENRKLFLAAQCLGDTAEAVDDDGGRRRRPTAAIMELKSRRATTIVA
jgi:hypothetical protein